MDQPPDVLFSAATLAWTQYVCCPEKSAMDRLVGPFPDNTSSVVEDNSKREFESPSGTAMLAEDAFVELPRHNQPPWYIKGTGCGCSTSSNTSTMEWLGSLVARLMSKGACEASAQARFHEWTRRGRSNASAGKARQGTFGGQL